jgi:hypothetical protein
MDAQVGFHEGECTLTYLHMYARAHTFVLMHHFLNNLEACMTCATELGIESLDMSAKCVEFVKRGHKEYKAFEAIVKGWKAKAVEVASEAIECMSFTTPPPPPLPALHCVPCVSRNLVCRGKPGRRCPPCNVSKCTCNFCKRFAIFHIMVCADICIARPNKVLPKHATGDTSAKETVSSVLVNNGGTFEGFNMEVEVIEHAPGESSPSAKGSTPNHALSPSASAP